MSMKKIEKFNICFKLSGYLVRWINLSLGNSWKKNIVHTEREYIYINVLYI